MSRSMSTPRQALVAVALGLWLGSAAAALPTTAQTPEAQAKAEEAKAKAAEAAKKATADLAAAVDRAVENYQANKNK